MTSEKPRPLPWKQFRGGIGARWKVPFLWFEWLCEFISYHLSRWAFIEVLEYVGKLSLLGAVILFIWDIPKRRQADEDARKAKTYVAWQTLNSAVGKPGNAGRADALQDLNRDGISLAAVDVSGGMFPKPIMLAGADMMKANIFEAYFRKPVFTRTKMNGARIEKSSFYFADFRRTDLSSASLAKIEFYGCDFSSATIRPDECKEVKFVYCQFHGTNIDVGTPSVHFTDTDSSVRQATVVDTIFKGCNFTNCHFNIPADQLNPKTFIYCNLFGTKSGYADVQSYAIKDHMNASVPKVKFFDWLDWLSQNRRNLAAYNPEYDVFYQADDERIRRDWPTEK